MYFIQIYRNIDKFTMAFLAFVGCSLNNLPALHPSAQFHPQAKINTG